MAERHFYYQGSTATFVVLDRCILELQNACSLIKIYLIKRAKRHCYLEPEKSAVAKHVLPHIGHEVQLKKT